MIAHEKGFKFHAQLQTGACSCSFSHVQPAIGMFTPDTVAILQQQQQATVI